jgi:hypothetical protein
MKDRAIGVDDEDGHLAGLWVTRLHDTLEHELLPVGRPACETILPYRALVVEDLGYFF